MAQEKTRPWIIILLIVIILIFIAVGAYTLYHDATSIAGYLFLGLGLGGGLAAWGLYTDKEL
ncbi:hypothetical protein F4V57_04450 [Acinetobacter qingfengensis]|uniref:Uncharacterized protein n=1 Tax=Acinetobacter qingfengensis TaxID=1262585 RepID=A0A1E7REE5_9GAMM|nr:hypothetical protein [Acinetobacter qingfengensis]KAA8735012.1 hypothetical protein F4V57_04450 [Acinetobacter qingfengensis]OEY97734.1 hypothetical protein BJI46_08245 [Acinetobacter qingfengensis]